jgi:hypothetical protein
MEDTFKFHDRRASVRLKMDHPALCTRFDHLGRQCGQRISYSINVSLGGARFQSNFPVNSGEVLEITMALDDNLVTFRAKVVYVTPSEDRGFEFGVSFIDSEYENRIALTQFIYHFKGPVQR